MKDSFLLSITLASAFGLLVSACSGDDDSGGNNTNAGPTSSVAAEKELSGLTADEVTKLNQDMANYAAQQMAGVGKNATCRYMGVMMGLTSSMTDTSGGTPTDASLQQACSSMVDLCMQSSSTDTSGSSGDSSTQTELTAGSLSGCTATVAEYEGCIKDQTSALFKMMNSAPQCSELKASSIEATMAAFEPSASEAAPASCEAVAAKCAGLASVTN